jgi:hypothetical protein
MSKAGKRPRPPAKERTRREGIVDLARPLGTLTDEEARSDIGSGPDLRIGAPRPNDRAKAARGAPQRSTARKEAG